MPRLLIVIARLNKGGTAQYIGQLATQLPKHGYQVLVATGYVQGLEIEDEITKKIPITRIKHLGRKIKPINDLKSRKELKSLIKEFKPDLIYSHTFKAGAITRSMKTDIPIIHAFHGHLLEEPELAGIKIKIVTWIERKLAPRAKYLVTVGKKVAKDLQKTGIGTKSQYISIAPGVTSLKLISKKEARKSLGIDNEKRPIIVWLARVVAVKGPERVIELAREFPNARFLMTGGGYLINSIKNQAPDNLSVIGWKDAKEIWSVADIAISTSENEGMPIALIEAQLAGIPVVAIDVGSVSEVVDSGKTGYVSKEFNRQYFQYLNQLLVDKKLRLKFGNEAIKHANKEFVPERLIQEHLKLFKKTI